MDLTGKVYRDFTTGRYEHSLTEPYYLAVQKETSGEMIYVSDHRTDTITNMSLKGQVLGAYTHDNWHGILRLTFVGDGQLLVSNLFKHTVDLVSNHGKDTVTLIDSTHGLDSPRTLCYNPSEATLYVSSNDGKPISAFKLTNK